MKSTLYTLLIKPNGEFPCKRQYLHNAFTDLEAIKMAKEYAQEKKAEIFSLTKTIKEDHTLIGSN